jgi:inner membrane protein
MTARTHDLAAVTTLVVSALFVTLPSMSFGTVVLAVFANLVGGIAPDIDQPTAPFWRNLPVGRYFGKIVDAMLGGHRFISHSLLGLMLFGFLVRGLLLFLHPVMTTIDAGIVWWAFMLGMVSHLIMDSSTKEGVPWLLPIPIKFGIPPFKSWRITTGKWVETWVVFPLLLVFNGWFFMVFYQELLTVVRKKIG